MVHVAPLHAAWCMVHGSRRALPAARRAVRGARGTQCSAGERSVRSARGRDHAVGPVPGAPRDSAYSRALCPRGGNFRSETSARKLPALAALGARLVGCAAGRASTVKVGRDRTEQSLGLWSLRQHRPSSLALSPAVLSGESRALGRCVHSLCCAERRAVSGAPTAPPFLPPAPTASLSRSPCPCPPPPQPPARCARLRNRRRRPTASPIACRCAVVSRSCSRRRLWWRRMQHGRTVST
jgi:hypothetical protein